MYKLQRREIILCILLSIVTCGIYWIYWFYTILSDLYRINERESKAGMDLLFTFITCGLYALYLYYQMGKMLNDARIKYKLNEKDDSLLFIILALFGLGIVNCAIVQNALNTELGPVIDARIL